MMLRHKKYAFFIAASTLVLACKHMPEKQGIRLPVTGKNGLLHKNQTIPFLIGLHLADSTQLVPTPGDSTVAAKYMHTADGKYVALVSIFGKTDEPDQLAFATTDSAGFLLAYTVIDAWDSWCAASSVESFAQVGNYYLVKGCGHGSGYYNESARVFAAMKGLTASNQIFLSNYSYYNLKHAGYAQQIRSDLSTIGDTIVVTYTVEKGNKDNDDIIWEVDTTVQVRYQLRQHVWVAHDSTLLAGMDMEE